MKLRYFSFIFCIICSTTFGDIETNTLPEPHTGKLFVGVTYTYALQKRDIFKKLDGWKTKWHTNTTAEVIYRGSYWAVNTQLGRVYVTATHLFGNNLEVKQIDGHVVDNNRCKIIGCKIRAYLGTLGYEVDRIGHIEGLEDIVFILPERHQISEDIPVLKLAVNIPRINEEVRAVGYTGTPHQQITKCDVTSVHETQAYMILNKPVDSGFSGGPVLNTSGHVYGVISNTDKGEKQTTVIRLSENNLSQIIWHPLSYYEDLSK